MPKQRELPSLDFLKGFDAAARHMSFTLAAEELFLTQSALSRQIKTLEEEIGHALFVRGHRSLTLTDAGLALQPVVRDALGDIARAVAAIRARHRGRRVSVSTTVPFASLWLIPRLPKFRQSHPDVEVFVSADNQLIDLERGQIDIAVRYTKENLRSAGGRYLFGERIVPVVSPALLRDRSRPLKKLADLAHQVLLHLEDPLGRTPWVDWTSWLTSSGAADVVPAGNLRFSQYDLLLQAAISGQGVALGRSPLIDHALSRGELVTPFPRRYDAPRGYFVLAAPHMGARSEVGQFIDWIAEEAALANAAADHAEASGDAPMPARRPRPGSSRSTARTPRETSA
jgi:DNA-binding transcriptional LysR family regulator